MGIAFIQDKLEIKFLILYIVSRLTEPVDGADLQDMTMCDEGIDYFDYAECLGDLVKTEHLRVTEDGQYVITKQRYLREQPAIFRKAAVGQAYRGLEQGGGAAAAGAGTGDAA